MKKLFFTIISYSFLGLSAQYKNLYFDRLTVESGLPQEHILCHLQDQFGYMWLGTQNGLVRYDGYHSKKYSLPDDQGKPVNLQLILTIQQAGDGNIWVNVGEEGLYYWTPQNDRFQKVKDLHYKNKELQQQVVTGGFTEKRPDFIWFSAFESNHPHFDLFNTKNHTMEVFSSLGDAAHFIPTYHTSSIKNDANGNLWLSGDSLLCRFDTLKSSFVPYSLMVESEKGLVFADLFPDPGNPDIIWTTTLQRTGPGVFNFVPGPVMSFNIKTKIFKKYIHDDKDPQSIPNNCAWIVSDKHKRMWFSNTEVFALLDPAKENFRLYSFPKPPGTGSSPLELANIVFNEDDNIWTIGAAPGLFFLDTHNGQAEFFPNGGSMAGSLPNVTIDDIFLDRTGSLWCMISFLGIARLNMQKSFFNDIPIEPPVPETMQSEKNSKQFNTAFRLDDSSILVSTNQRFFIWSYFKNTFKTLDAGLYLPGCADALKDRQGTIWVATNSGILEFDPGTGKAVHFKSDPNDSTTISRDRVHNIAEGKNGTIWVATWGRGLCSIDKLTGKCTRYPYSKGTDFTDSMPVLDDGYIQSLMVDHSGIVWIGTNGGGLNRLDPATHQFSRMASRKDGLFSIISIFEDKQHRIWAGSYVSGLFLVDFSAHTYKRYSEENGLTYNGINGIAEDDQGIIWTSTLRGLSRLDLQNNKVSVYTKANALSNNETFSIWRSANGHINVIGKEGLITFNPAAVQKNRIPPSLAFESIKYHEGRSAEFRQDTTVFLYQNPAISLEHNDSRITFSYIGLHFANPALNQYAYKLEKYDKDWIPAGTERTATYTNLPPGNYTFRVKASNSDGVWSDNGAGITIVIHPPWWQTWWAYISYVLLAIAGVWAFTSYRSKKLIKDNRVLEHKVKERTQEVIEQKEEITVQRDHLEKTLGELKSTQKQLIHSEKMASLGELTSGIAHEIQNPLNFVNNFSEVSKELIVEMKTELDDGNSAEAKLIADDIEKNLEKINHHGKRAESIVKSMMQHGQKSTGKKELTDINGLASEYFRLSYHGFRARDTHFNASMKMNLDEGMVPVMIIPADIGRALLNIFNNAFYAVSEKARQSPAGFHPQVNLVTTKQEKTVVIEISDNGNGIPDTIIDKIFQPFFTTRPTNEGTGLGLSLCYDIIKAHGGEIKVETHPGQGSSFIVSLPA